MAEQDCGIFPHSASMFQEVAGSKPVVHPAWAKFKLSTKGTILGPV
jgi:hypothetical protein